MANVKIKITASVVATVNIGEETIEQLKKRVVDIYLHGAGDNGHLQKNDLGADEWNIEIVDGK